MPPDAFAHHRPSRVTEVNAYLTEHGIIGVTLRRGRGYFQFWGVPISGWLSNVVMQEKLDALTLGRWLVEYKKFERLNSRKVNLLTAKKRVRRLK